MYYTSIIPRFLYIRSLRLYIINSIARKRQASGIGTQPATARRGEAWGRKSAELGVDR